MARGLNARHAVKQVDRMLSNPGIDVDQILALWVPFVIGARTSLLVAMDWTDFDADNRDCLEIGGAGAEAVVSRLISDRG
jgi:hypothetical protein